MEKKGLLNWYKGKNIGWAMSFMELLYHAPQAEYYAFCDQDDVWTPYKLYEATKKMSLLQNPIKLYCSNLLFYKDGINHGITKKYDINQYTIQRAFLRNIATGCTVVFSAPLRNLICQFPPKQILAHDYWLFLTASVFGEVTYDPASYILYRQHSSNQIGAKTSTIEKWKRRLKEIRIFSKQHIREELAKEFLRTYSKIVPQEYKQIIQIIANYRQNLRFRFHLLLSPKFVMEKRSNTFWIKLRIILGNL